VNAMLMFTVFSMGPGLSYLSGAHSECFGSSAFQARLKLSEDLHMQWRLSYFVLQTTQCPVLR
jgi:hypothetical protein